MWMDNWVLNLPFSLWPDYSKNLCSPQRFLFRCFESLSTVVVLANSNSAETEVNTDECIKKNIPILRRKGGGGTVVLTPGCLILTLAFYAKELYANDVYFAAINTLWINSLKDCGILNIEQRGISDLAVNHRKIAGTSLFRRKHLLVFQGSLLVDPDMAIIQSLLQHPSREPNYRQGRQHKDFMTTLRQLGFNGTTEELSKHCNAYIKQHGLAHLGIHLLQESNHT